MPNKEKHIVIGITGASGSIYAKTLIEELLKIRGNQNIKIDIILSSVGKEVFAHEIQENFFDGFPLTVHDNNNYYAPFASGSSCADALVVIPCSMGTLGRIAHGTSDNLICRTADVVLKEKKKLIIVARETPLNLIHLKNMELITLAGGIVLPASPSFYLNPKTIQDLVNSVVYRVLDLLEININVKRWGRNLEQL